MCGKFSCEFAPEFGCRPVGENCLAEPVSEIVVSVLGGGLFHLDYPVVRSQTYSIVRAESLGTDITHTSIRWNSSFQPF